MSTAVESGRKSSRRTQIVERSSINENGTHLKLSLPGLVQRETFNRRGKIYTKVNNLNM